jgi:hypothetical protein
MKQRAKMTPAKQQHKDDGSKDEGSKARQQAWLQRAMVTASHGRTASDPKRITDPKCTTPPRTAHAQPHVHSPCAQPLDDGSLPDVKM